MRHDHPFSQRKKTTERAVGVGLEVTGKGRRGWTKFEIVGGGGGKIWGFLKKTPRYCQSVCVCLIHIRVFLPYI